MQESFSVSRLLPLARVGVVLIQQAATTGPCRSCAHSAGCYHWPVQELCSLSRLLPLARAGVVLMQQAATTGPCRSCAHSAGCYHWPVQESFSCSRLQPLARAGVVLTQPAATIDRAGVVLGQMQQMYFIFDGDKQHVLGIFSTRIF